MFSVYGISGQLFRGSMEQLRQIGGVGALARTHAVQAVGRDGHDPADDAAGLLPHHAVKAVATDEPHRSALAAYSETQNAPRQRHPLSTVADVMSPQVITLTDQASVLQAWQILSAKGVGQAPLCS